MKDNKKIMKKNEYEKMEMNVVKEKRRIKRKAKSKGKYYGKGIERIKIVYNCEGE